MKAIRINGITIDIALESLNTYLNTLNKANINKRANIILTKFIILYIYIYQYFILCFCFLLFVFLLFVFFAFLFFCKNKQYLLKLIKYILTR